MAERGEMASREAVERDNRPDVARTSIAITLHTTGADETLAVGEAIGRWVQSGDLIALDGPLGSGKTQLVKGIARGLGVAADEPVISPTFVLVREYAGRLRLYHLDAYRLGDWRELEAIGFEELRESGGVIAMEWAERVGESLPPDALRIRLAYGDTEQDRHITLQCAVPGRREALAKALHSICTQH